MVVPRGTLLIGISGERWQYMIKSQHVPVIDIGPLVRDNGQHELDQIVEEIGAACREWGFFQILDHGIPSSQIKDVRKAYQQFFALPRSTKHEVLRSKSNPRGYYDRELTKNTRDLKEVFDFGFKPEPDLPDDDPANCTLDGYNQWPSSMPEFKQTMEEYLQACEQLGLKLTEGICLSLGLARNRLHPYLVGSHTSFVRLNHYPREDPLLNENESDVTPLGEMGVHHHSDAGILTILLQDDIAGLQVYKQDEWFMVDPIPNALVVNLGDMMQVLSNDRYNAPLHRVQASKDTERYSVPFFYNPSYDMNCYPLGALCENESSHYTEISWREFRSRRAEGDYADYGKEVQISDYRVV